MRFRRLFQFHLRTLLVILAALSVWFGFYVRNVRSQQAAVQAIRDYGGSVRYDFQYPTGTYTNKDFEPKAQSRMPRWLLDRLSIDFFHDVVYVTLNYSEDNGTSKKNENPSDAALHYLPRLANLRVLKLSGTQASDTGLLYVGKLKKLERLTMWDVSTVSDAGVEHLRHLAKLKSLFIHNSRIADGSLHVFGRMNTLEELYLQGNQFTDDGLSSLAELTKLRDLVLTRGSTSFTDRGLIHLKGLISLEFLCIQGSGITDEGIKHLGTLESLRSVRITSNTVTPEGLATLQAKLPTTRCVLSRSTAGASGDRD